jgi:hypothetical protein
MPTNTALFKRALSLSLNLSQEAKLVAIVACDVAGQQGEPLCRQSRD